MKNKFYELIDSGNGKKLERFGDYTLIRPCSQAIWNPQKTRDVWRLADASFSRYPQLQWSFKNKIPEFWEVELNKIKFKLSLTDFGHLGIFPEHHSGWEWIQNNIQEHFNHTTEIKNKPFKVLNLFAYTGAATLAAAQAGAHVCHLDSSRGMVDRARENAKINGLSDAPIRWIIEDVRKFLTKEIKRKSLYEGIILDPPSFGKGKKGEVFKMEEHIIPLLQDCIKLLSKEAKFLYFSSHTPGFTPLVMERLLGQMLKSKPGVIESGESLLGTAVRDSNHEEILSIPSGTYAKWKSKG